MAFPIKTLLQAFNGQRNNLTGEKITKGLLASKTANVAHGALAGKLLAVWVLPLNTGLQWVLSIAVLVEWGSQLYLRVKTSEPV